MLQSMNLEKEMCVGQGYDAASVMSGERGGVQALMKRAGYTNAQYVHCASHRLNLVLASVTEIDPAIKTFFETMDLVYTFMTRTKRHSPYLEIQKMLYPKDPQLELTHSSTTRYCPSLESKIIRFGPKQHLIWLEPEGFNNNVVYPSGISCTMPEVHQVELIRCIPGLEKCELVQAGYGVEYDYMDPRQLKASLETLCIGNLFFAGQINGTTGYEEAAAQGIIAGINAASKVQDKSPLIIDRSEGYIGVMIDDLTTLGTNEPYRMFTSRAEFRLFLRPDNADMRLTEKGFHQGCVSHHRYEKTQKMQTDLKENIEWLKTVFKRSNEWQSKLNLQYLFNPHKRSAFQMICDPHIDAVKLALAFPDVFQHLLGKTILLERLSIEVKYSRDLEEQLIDINEVRQDEMLEIPEDLDYYSMNIANEAKNKLTDARPRTIAAASRIPGVTPAALVALLKSVKKNKQRSKSYNSRASQDSVV